MISKFFQVGFGLGLGLTTGVILILSVLALIDFIIKKIQF